MSLRATDIPPETLAGLPEELQEQASVYYELEQPKIRATMAVCLLIAYVAMGLRLYARRFTKQPVGLDDIFTGLAVFFTTISVGLVAHLTNLGYGRHEIVIVVEHIDRFDALNRTIVASITMYLPVIFCVKASVLLLYRRVFPTRTLHIICYVIMGFTAVYALTAILWLTISCLPPPPPTPEEPVAQLKCPNMHLGIALIIILIINVLLDAIILCLPLPLICGACTQACGTRFNLPWSSRLSIVAVSLPVIRPILHQAMYRKDGSSRLYLFSKNRRSSQDHDEGGRGSISLLTFGRGGLKGSSGRKPRGLDVTTVGTVITAEAATSFDNSIANLVPEDADPREDRQKPHV